MKLKDIKAFTLLEVLVVLVIVSLLATVLTQGISHVLGLRYHFQAQLELQRASFLQDRWIGQICRGLAPDRNDGKEKFSGGSEKFHGLSLAALDSETGVPVPVTLELTRKNQDIILQYREREGEPWELALWHASQGRFTYLDETGRWVSQWPPPTILDTSQQLPSAIMLDLQGASNAVGFLIDLPGRHAPKSFILDSLL